MCESVIDTDTQADQFRDIHQIYDVFIFILPENMNSETTVKAESSEKAIGIECNIVKYVNLVGVIQTCTCAVFIIVNMTISFCK